MKTKRIVSVICLSLVLALSIAVATMKSVNANADTNVFAMVTGASIRLSAGKVGDEDITNGIRFRVKMDNDTAELIDGTTKKLYFFVAPKDIVDVSKAEHTEIESYKDKWLEVDVSKIYQDVDEEDDKVYSYANAVLCNLSADFLGVTFNTIAIIETVGEPSTYEYAQTADTSRSMYEVVNKAVLDVNEDYTARIMGKSAALDYKNWYGTENYPIKITSVEEYDKLVEEVNAGNVACNELNISSGDIKPNEQFEQDKEISVTNYYKVTFNGERFSKTVLVKENEKVEDPIDNTDDYLPLVDWYDDDNKFDFTSPITEDLELTAQYKDTDSEIKVNYAVCYDWKGDAGDGYGSVEFGEEIGKQTSYLSAKRTTEHLGIISLQYGYDLTTDDVQDMIDEGYQHVKVSFYITAPTETVTIYYLNNTTAKSAETGGWFTKYFDSSDFKSYLDTINTQFSNTQNMTTFLCRVKPSENGEYGMAISNIEFVPNVDVTYMYNDVELGTSTIAQDCTVKDDVMSSLSSSWKLNGKSYDLSTPVTESITLVTDKLSYEFNFEGEDSDNLSYEKTGAGKWDLQRSGDTLEGIVRPVGRPNGINTSNMAMVCIWKFIITQDVVNAFKTAGYTHLSFDVYISASTGIASNSCSFLGESVTVDGFENGTVKQVDLDIDKFATWVAGGMDNSFMITPPCQGTNTIFAVGNFEFTKQTPQTKKPVVTFKYNDIEIGTAEVESGSTVENDGIIGFASKWQLDGVDYDLTTSITEDITLVATGDLFNTFNFVDENKDITSYEMVGGSKYDLKRSEQTLWGIVRPVGRPEYDNRVTIGSNPIECYWKFVITPEIIRAYKALGYTHLAFDVVLYSDSGSGLSGSTISFLNESIQVADVKNDTVKHVTLDIDAFANWVEGGMTTTFMKTCGINGQGRILAGNFEFVTFVTYKYGDVVIGSSEVKLGETVANEDIAKLSSSWRLNGESYDLSTPITAGITLVTEELSYEFNFEGENADTISYEKTSTAKWDLKRSEDTIEGIVRPVGRPAGFGAGGNNIVCIWKFKITSEIISIFKTAGYTHLSFDVYISASDEITSNSCSFLGESIVEYDFVNGELKHVDLDIDAFATWVAGGMDNSFMITPPCKGAKTIFAVGNFEFTTKNQ